LKEEVVMKKMKIYYLFIFVSGIIQSSCIISSSQQEKDKAQQQIVVLRDQIKNEENAYKTALQHTLNEAEKNKLIVQYTQKKQNLFKQIRQQRDILKDDSTQKWLWDTAKVIGPIAIAGLVAYKFFASSPTAVQIQLEPQKPLIKLQEPQTILQLQPTPQSTQVTAQPSIPLTKEEVQKYRSASKAYGATAAWFAINALVDPLFYPYAAATFLGSLYYGAKSLNLDLKPVSFEQIKIVPEELPY